MEGQNKGIANLKPIQPGQRLPGLNKNRPKQYLTPLLKKLLNKEIELKDPETAQLLGARVPVKLAIMWRLLLNAAQGENEAIKIILERLDGKVNFQIGEGGSAGASAKVVIIVQEGNKSGDQSPQGRLPGSISIQRE